MPFLKISLDELDRVDDFTADLCRFLAKNPVGLSSLIF